jgi:hypothetical protein
MARHIEQTFENTIIELDNNEFERCIFKRCVFRYGGAQHFIIDDGDMQDCQIEFVAEAANAIVAIADLIKTPLRASIRGQLVGSIADLFKVQS